MDSQTERYSLYLQPEGQEMRSLTKTMSELAQKFDCPEFVPHVTLIPERWGILQHITDSARLIAQTIHHPFPITLREVGIGDSYFKCVFFTVEETPELLLLAQKAREIFGVTLEEVPFRAHFSMLYDGRDSSQSALTIEQKQAAAQVLRDHITLPFVYTCTGIAVHTSTPIVSEWQQVAFVPFK